MALNNDNESLIQQINELKAENSRLKNEVQMSGILKNAVNDPSSLYKIVLGAESEVIYTISNEGIVTSVSPHVEKILGWKPEEVIGKHYNVFIHSEYTKFADTLHASILNNEQPGFFELTCICKDGSYLTGEFSIVPIFDGTKVIGTLGIGRDITSKKKIEDELKQSEEKYRILFETATDIIYTVNPEGIVMTVNPYVTQACGWELEEVIGKSFTFFMHPEELPYAMQIHHFISQGKRTPIFELRFLHKNGHYLNAEFSITPFYKDGQLLGTLGIGRDVTDRNKAQEIVKKSEQQQKAILNNISDIVWLKDIDGRYITINEAFEKFFGIKNEHLAGKTSMDILPMQSALLQEQDHNQVVKTGKTVIKEEDFNLSGRPGRCFEMSIAPVFNHEGAVIGTTGIAHDITERKKVEEQLITALKKEKELNSLKARFLETVSHEFRTPMSIIILGSEMLDQEPERIDSEKKALYIKKIRESISKMTGLLDDVLMITKNDANKIGFNPSRFDLLRVCESIIEDIRLTNKNGCVINFNYSDILRKEKKIMGDESLIRYILINLVSNAVKYSPNNGIVDFKVDYNESNKLVFNIKDNGIGIPETDMPILFETFHRAGNVGTIKGTGLGLSIVKRCIELHGGSIKVESKVNAGSEFTVNIPLFI